MAIDRNKPGSFEISIVSDGRETTVNAEFFGNRSDKAMAFWGLVQGLEIDVIGGELDKIVTGIKKKTILDQLNKTMELLESMMNEADCEDEEYGE